VNRIGIDLGGTKIEAVVIDADGRVLARERRPTPRMDYDATVAAIESIVHALEANAARGAPVGLGTPGAWQPERRAMKNCNSTWLNGRPLLSDLTARLGNRVRIANDADCLTLSEALDGAGTGAPTVFGAIVGTGVGGGIVVRGELVTGPNAIAGEWGHTPLPYFRDATAAPRELAPSIARLEPRDCYCGRRNCVETFLSGPGLARTHAELWNQLRDPVELAAAADRAASHTLELHALLLARSLAQLINVLDPHVIVLGGGLSNIDALYRRVPDLWGAYVFSPDVATPLRRARHGDASGVLGAARLWPAR
jgi:fructokinase